MTATTWGELFERAAAFDATEAGIASALRTRRESEGEQSESVETGTGAEVPAEPSPARVVADADVLAADLLVGGDARRALDGIREHSWAALVASDVLLDDAEAVVCALADAELAADWRAKVETPREPVAHRRGNHPALASARVGGAMHVLSLDDRMLAPGTAATVRSRVETSVKHPKAFATLFDAESLYRAVHGEGSEYPGPDRDPRA